MASENAEIDEIKSDLKKLREDLVSLGKTMEQRGYNRAQAEYDAVERRIGNNPLISAFTAFSLGFLTGRIFSR